MKQPYSRRQLVLAKCAVVALIALVAGPGLADDRSEIPITILVVLALVGAAVMAFEAVSRGLAFGLGRFWRDAPATAGEPMEAPAAISPPDGALRRRDVLIALLLYFGAEALVWIIASVVAVIRSGNVGDQAAFLRELTTVVPIALPGSLIAGGIVLLIVLRRWRKRLGGVALATMLGLTWGRPRQVTNGALAGVTLALFILPLVGLVADRAEPPDVMTQIAGSSTFALLAWMLSAVLLAPPIEELMFRGALLGGLAETWNIRAAALISGTTFWLMHGPEFVHWPAAIAIGLLTILATWLRLKSRSLGPAIAAHFGYNLVLATLAALAMLYGPGESRWARDHQPSKRDRMDLGLDGKRALVTGSCATERTACGERPWAAEACYRWALTTCQEVVIFGPPPPAPSEIHLDDRMFHVPPAGFRLGSGDPRACHSRAPPRAGHQLDFPRLIRFNLPTLLNPVFD